MSDQPPEQKNGLLELLKNLGAPVAGFIGAVTLACNKPGKSAEAEADFAKSKELGGQGQ